MNPNHVCVSVLLCLGLFTKASSYCWQIGWNPTFKGPPTISQLNLTSILISWKGMVDMIECADQVNNNNFTCLTGGEFQRSSLIALLQVKKQVVFLFVYFTVDVAYKFIGYFITNPNQDHQSWHWLYQLVHK